MKQSWRVLAASRPRESYVALVGTGKPCFILISLRPTPHLGVDGIKY
jgi:hypothetical protein